MSKIEEDLNLLDDSCLAKESIERLMMKIAEMKEELDSTQSAFLSATRELSYSFI